MTRLVPACFLLVPCVCLGTSANDRALLGGDPRPAAKKTKLKRDKLLDFDRHGDTRENFAKNIEPLVEGIEKARKLVIYEGLPHQHWESGLLARERKEKKTVTLHGFPFYAQPIAPRKADGKELSALGADASSFRRYSGMKWCGGFHPDWCIEWQDGATVYRALICFGCHEARLYGPKNGLYCDLDNEVLGKFGRLLKPYRKHRPGPEERPGWKKLPRVDLDKEVKIEIDKEVARAGIHFSEWRWLGKNELVVAWVRPSKRPLVADALRWTNYAEDGTVLGTGPLDFLGRKRLEINESGWVEVSVRAEDEEKVARVVIKMAPPAKDKRR
jgi:hypothetical protein